MPVIRSEWRAVKKSGNEDQTNSTNSDFVE